MLNFVGRDCNLNLKLSKVSIQTKVSLRLLHPRGFHWLFITFLRQWHHFLFLMFSTDKLIKEANSVYREIIFSFDTYCSINISSACLPPFLVLWITKELIYSQDTEPALQRLQHFFHYFSICGQLCISTLMSKLLNLYIT